MFIFCPSKFKSHVKDILSRKSVRMKIATLKRTVVNARANQSRIPDLGLGVKCVTGIDIKTIFAPH